MSWPWQHLLHMQKHARHVVRKQCMSIFEFILGRHGTFDGTHFVHGLKGSSGLHSSQQGTSESRRQKQQCFVASAPVALSSLISRSTRLNTPSPYRIPSLNNDLILLSRNLRSSTTATKKTRRIEPQPRPSPRRALPRRVHYIHPLRCASMPAS